MKRIEFISPVEAVRGNMSGRQLLKYADNDNPAWNAPEGTNYARNYQPRFVGAKVSKTGRKYFAVRTKSATKISAKTKQAMALLGGSAALYAAALQNLAIYSSMVAYYTEQVAESSRDIYTLRMFWMERFRAMLSAKTIQYSFTTKNGHQTIINNPWVDGGAGVDLDIKNETIVKFFMQLANDAVEFVVTGAGKGYAHQGDTWIKVASSKYNVLGINTSTNVKIGSDWIIDDNDQYVVGNVAIDATVVYKLTDVNPAP